MPDSALVGGDSRHVYHCAKKHYFLCLPKEAIIRSWLQTEGMIARKENGDTAHVDYLIKKDLERFRNAPETSHGT